MQEAAINDGEDEIEYLNMRSRLRTQWSASVSNTRIDQPAGAMALRLPSGSSNQRSAAPPGGTWKSIMEGMQYIRVRPRNDGIALAARNGSGPSTPD